MATYIDIKSYERRIEEEREHARAYLENGNYERLLTSVGRLMKLTGGLEEAQYQLER